MFACIIIKMRVVGFAEITRKEFFSVKRRSKGEGTIRKRIDGRWEGRYIDSSGTSKYIYGHCKKEVREKLTEITYIQDKNIFDRVGGDVPLSIWFEHYIKIKQYQVKERSLYQINLAFHNHIEPVIGNKLLYKINTNDIIKVIDRLNSKKLNPTTIKNIVTHMKAMFNYALQEGSIPTNPTIAMHIEREQKSSRSDLSDEVINLILETVKSRDEKFHLMLCTLLYTGIRVGELCALKWNDIGDDYQSIRIDESLTDRRFESTTKTESSVRIIPIPEQLSREYRKWFIKMNSLYNKKNLIDEYVFLNKMQRPYTSTTVSKKLKYIKELIKEKYEIDLSYVTPHYFRHTFATIGLQNGVDIKDMQEMLGHADCKTLLKTYVHTNTSRKRASMNVIENSIKYRI